VDGNERLQTLGQNCSTKTELLHGCSQYLARAKDLPHHGVRAETEHKAS